MLHPINLVGQLYLQSIDTNTGLLTVADTDDLSVKGSAVITSDRNFVFYDDLGRNVGIMVGGPGFTDIPELLTFSAANTLLSSSAVYPMNQEGVRGFKLPDGSVVTGDVEIEGENGIEVRKEFFDGQEALVIHAIGVPVTDTCGLNTPLRCLVVDEITQSNITITRVDNVIQLGFRTELSELCRTDEFLPDENGVLPGTPDDPCEDPVVPPEPPPLPPVVPPLPCEEDHGGKYFVVSLSDSLIVEKAEVEQVPTPPSLEPLVDTLPPRNTGGIKLRIPIPGGIRPPNG
jgi:hypothetical protein